MSGFRPGDRVAGRFVVEGLLAIGGMAEIYVAEMSLARGVRKRVALKRIHGDLAHDPHFAAMFLDEARLLTQLAHPGLVPVHDVVEDHGELLLVLDYVPGWDLGSVLKGCREKNVALPLGAAVYLGQAVAETLAYVHGARDAQGAPLRIVHRDVNPSNILVAEDASVRLLDFGIARGATRLETTANRSIKGKLAYLAPEQVSGEETDARTDLYGLGLVLFELVTGARALREEAERDAFAAAREPRHVRASALRAGIPEPLDALIERLLAVDRASRPASAGEVVRELEPLRALIGPGLRGEIQEVVVRALGAPSRALRTGRQPFEEMLGKVAGLDLAAPGTRSLATKPDPAPDPEPQDRPPEDGPVPSHTVLLLPRRRAPVRHRLAIGAIAAALAIGAAALLVRVRLDPPEPAAPPQADRRGFLRVTSEPPGAHVSIDGAGAGETTPLIVESPAGRERAIALSLADHVGGSTRASAREGETTRVHLVLARQAGTIELRSKPPGADVELSGRVLGRTPITLEGLPREELRLRLSADGHEGREVPVDLRRQARVEIDVVLEPRIAMGTLDVSSTPWASVRVGGRLMAESTPVVGLRLPAGEHQVVLTNPRIGRSTKRVVKIRAGERTSLIVKLSD